MGTRDRMVRGLARTIRARAARAGEDPAEARRLADEAEAKAGASRRRLTGVFASLMALVRMVRAWVNGSYRAVPWTSILPVMAALVYFVMPFDLVPDFIVGFGLVDDAAVIAWVVKHIRDDLERFVAWEQVAAG